MAQHQQLKLSLPQPHPQAVKPSPAQTPSRPHVLREHLLKLLMVAIFVLTGLDLEPFGDWLLDEPPATQAMQVSMGVIDVSYSGHLSSLAQH